MWTHEVKLEKYQATTPGGGPLQLGTADSQGNEFLHIKAGEGWEGLAIKVVFRPCKVSRMVPKDGNNMVDVPWEATKEPLTAAKGKIVFRGLDESGRVMNSLDLSYEVKGHSPTEDRDETKYTPSAVDQIIAETKADAAAADLSAKAAAEAQKAAETSAAAALQSAKDSAGSALQASYAESEAEKSRLAAAGSANAAAGSAQQAAAAVQQVQEAGQQATEDVGTAQTSAVQAVQNAQSAAVQAVQGQQQTSVGAIQAAGSAAVEQVGQAGQQQILAVEKVGKTQIDNVAEAGSDRIEAVEKALEQAGQQATEAIETAQTNAVEAVGGAQSAAVQAVQDAQSTGVQAVQGQQQTSVGAVQAAETAAVGQVSQAGQQQVQAVKDEGATQTNAVAEAGSAQVQAVQQAGSQQITDIGEAGAQQVQAVNSAGNTKLDQINTAISHPPQPNTATGFWQVWNAETGQYEDTTSLYQGGYYTPSVSEDGTLTWTGSQAAMPELPSANIQGPQGLGVPTPSADNIGQVPTVNDAGDGYLLTGPYAPLEASIRPTVSGNPAVCSDSIAWSFQGLKVYGKSTQDGTPSPENPVPIVSAGEGGSLGLDVTGQNLLDVSALNLDGFSYNGITFSENSNHTFSLSGTSTGNYLIIYNRNSVIFLSHNKSYKFFYCGSEKVSIQAVVDSYNTLDDALNGVDSVKRYYFSDSENFIVPNDILYYRLIQIRFITRSGSIVGVNLNGEIVRIGYYFYNGVDEPWQPYVSQSLTLSTPSGLPGIPVDSGGNYTDSTGQQMKSDYVDFAQQAYCKSTLPFIFDGSSDENWGVNQYNGGGESAGLIGFRIEKSGIPNYWTSYGGLLCNLLVGKRCDQLTWNWSAGEGISTDGTRIFCVVNRSFIPSLEAWKEYLASNPMTVIFPAEELSTTPLLAEEISAYRALQTYSGTTVVSTAEPVAGIEARYILDGTAAWNKVNAALAQIGTPNTRTFASYEDLSGAIREGVNKTE